MRVVVLVAVLGGVAQAETFEHFGEQLEGEVREPELAFIQPLPAGLDAPLAPARIRDRLATYNRGIETTIDPFARAQLVLARADLWGARAIAMRHEPTDDYDAPGDDERVRALVEYGKLFRDPLLTSWAPMAGALFRMAFVQGLTDKHAAQFTYRRLLAEHPKSDYVAIASIVVGEYELARRETATARDAYDRAARHAATPPQLRVYALYKRAWCELLLDRHTDAFITFKQALSLGPQERLDDQLRHGIVEAYADFGMPSEAWETFERIAPGQQRAMMIALADRWADTRRYQSMTALNRELLRRFPRDPLACIWAERNADAVVTSKIEPDVLLPAVERLVAAFAEAGPYLSDEAAEGCRDTVVRYTFEAGRTFAQRFRDDPAKRVLADRLLEMFLRELPEHRLVGEAKVERMRLRK
jgi:hypothetical protein